MTIKKWAVTAVRDDKLRQYVVVDQLSPGRDETVIAEKINNRDDARLIAAAPELLDIAKCILVDDLLPYLPEEYIARVRSLIAKVE